MTTRFSKYGTRGRKLKNYRVPQSHKWLMQICIVCEKRVSVVTIGGKKVCDICAEELVITYTKDKQVGRNQPCPCNSGKKYKLCCRGN